MRRLFSCADSSQTAGMKSGNRERKRVRWRQYFFYLFHGREIGRNSPESAIEIRGRVFLLARDQSLKGDCVGIQGFARPDACDPVVADFHCLMKGFVCGVYDILPGFITDPFSPAGDGCAHGHNCHRMLLIRNGALDDSVHQALRQRLGSITECFRKDAETYVGP